MNRLFLSKNFSDKFFLQNCFFRFSGKNLCLLLTGRVLNSIGLDTWRLLLSILLQLRSSWGPQYLQWSLNFETLQHFCCSLLNFWLFFSLFLLTAGWDRLVWVEMSDKVKGDIRYRWLNFIRLELSESRMLLSFYLMHLILILLKWGSPFHFFVLEDKRTYCGLLCYFIWEIWVWWLQFSKLFNFFWGVSIRLAKEHYFS